MFNYFLHTKFLVGASLDQLLQCMMQLNAVQVYYKDEYDHFYQEEDINALAHVSGDNMKKVLFDRVGDNQFRHQVLPALLRKLATVPVVDNDIKQVNKLYPDKKNSYWGAVFPRIESFYLSTVADYQKFRQDAVDGVSIDDVWMMRHFLFPDIEFCSQTKRQFEAVKKTDLFADVVDSLKKLSNFAGTWKKGNFDMDVLAKTVDASYETKVTIDQFRKEHTFKINDAIGKHVCSEHLKVDGLRIHFYPDTNEHKVYIAYIGPHLATHKYR